MRTFIVAILAVAAALPLLASCSKSNWQPLGAEPPSGTHWQTTFDDEFTQDSTFRTDLWNGAAWLSVPGDPRPDATGGSSISVASDGTLTTPDGIWSFGVHLYYCGNAIMLNGVRAGFSCATTLLYYNGQMYAEAQESNGDLRWTQWYESPGAFSGMSFDPVNGLVVQPTLVPYVDGILYSGSPDLPAPYQTKFAQRYGYWEWKMKLPHDTNGEGDGIHPTMWLWPIGLDFSICTSATVGEIDVSETVIGPNNRDHTYFTVHDGCDGSGDSSFPYPTPGITDLATDFHTYGLYWRNDGSPEGSVQPYFDGVPQGSPITLKYSTAWKNGAYIIMNMDPCSPPFNDGTACTANTDHTNNPWLIQYVRVWQSMPD